MSSEACGMAWRRRVGGCARRAVLACVVLAGITPATGFVPSAAVCGGRSDAISAVLAASKCSRPASHHSIQMDLDDRHEVVVSRSTFARHALACNLYSKMAQRLNPAASQAAVPEDDQHALHESLRRRTEGTLAQGGYRGSRTAVAERVVGAAHKRRAAAAARSPAAQHAAAISPLPAVARTISAADAGPDVVSSALMRDGIEAALEAAAAAAAEQGAGDRSDSDGWAHRLRLHPSFQSAAAAAAASARASVPPRKAGRHHGHAPPPAPAAAAADAFHDEFALLEVAL